MVFKKRCGDLRARDFQGARPMALSQSAIYGKSVPGLLNTKIRYICAFLKLKVCTVIYCVTIIFINVANFNVLLSF